ncbi:transposase family protein [Rhizobium halophilum]|uniref:transposase family protein n=1 Tax=Rhizobium halophilum TaxID=2846852 RepID=UPI001EFE69A3|nr:transposase family protein [Rhizobium halophilum]
MANGYDSRLRTIHELKLGPDRPEQAPVQGFSMKPGEAFIVSTPDLLRHGTFVFERWFQPDSDSAVKAMMKHVDSNETAMFSNWHLAELPRAGRIRPLVGKEEARRNLPGAALAVREDSLKKAGLKLAYVEAARERMAEKRGAGLTRPEMQELIAEVAEKTGDPKPPCRASVYNYLANDRRGGNFDPLMNHVRKEGSGWWRKTLSSEVRELIADAVSSALQVGGRIDMMKTLVLRLVREDGEYFHIREQVVDTDGGLKISETAIYRHAKKMGRYVHDHLLHGRDYAERVHGAAIAQVRPDAPLVVVDVDHTTMDITVYDPELPIAYGRPDLLVFRDRYSGVVVGYSISFGKPSWQTFLDGLQHMMFEKDPDLMNGARYPYFGNPLQLGTDNAKHLVGINIQAAARQFGFTTVAYRPARGCEKGALEHLFGILNIHVEHLLPGTTRSNPEERMKLDEERRKAEPVLTLPELRGFLDYYFANIYHKEPHKGLGELATIKGVPEDLWREGIRRAPVRPLIDRDIFTRLAGDVTDGTITNNGFQWDGLYYNSGALQFVRAGGHKRGTGHKQGRRGHKGTQYKASRNPNNLDRIWVVDPWGEKDRAIEVPVAGAQADYAAGLRLDQHRKILAYRREQAKEAGRKLDLLEAKMELASAMVALQQKRKKAGTAALLAQFLSSMTKKFARSRRYEMRTVNYDGGHIDLASPAVVDAPLPFSSRSAPVMPGERAAEDTAPFEDMIQPPLPATLIDYSTSYDEPEEDGYDV